MCACVEHVVCVCVACVPVWSVCGVCGCAVCWGGDEVHSDPVPCRPSQAKAAKSEQEAPEAAAAEPAAVPERYVCPVLFSAYLHLEKAVPGRGPSAPGCGR